MDVETRGGWGVFRFRRCVEKPSVRAQRFIFLSSVECGNKHNVVVVLQLVVQLPLRETKTFQIEYKQKIKQIKK